MPRDPKAIAAAIRQKTVDKLAAPMIAEAEAKAELEAQFVTRVRKARKQRLTERQRLMVEYYFTDARFVKFDACRMAGYAHSKQAAMAEFDKPQVIAEVKRRADQAEKRYEVTYDRLVDELAKLAFFNVSDVMEFDPETGEFTGVCLDEASIDAMAALGEIKIEPVVGQEKPRVTVKPYDKMKAITELMKHAGLSREVKQVHHAHEVTMADRLRKGREKMNKRLLQELPIEAEFEVIENAKDTADA